MKLLSLRTVYRVFPIVKHSKTFGPRLFPTPGSIDSKFEWPVLLIKDYRQDKFESDRIKIEIYPETQLLREKPVGEPYREVCQSHWKGNLRNSSNRIQWRIIFIIKKFQEELKKMETWIITPKGHGSLEVTVTYFITPMVTVTFVLDLDLRVKHLTWQETIYVQVTL